MKHKGIIAMSGVLLLNIIFTQYTVNHYFHQNYKLVLLFAALNILMFPVALYIYRKEGRKHGS